MAQSGSVPSKTAAGTDEIGTRRNRLSTRARTLLIAIDGHHSTAELQTMFAAFGDIVPLLDELGALGLITGGPVSATPAARVASPAPPAAAAPAPPPAAAAIEAAANPGESPLMQARRVMNEVAVASLGLRAFGFTLKLEHCYTADELRTLLPTFLQLVTKAKGAAVAAELDQRISALIARG